MPRHLRAWQLLVLFYVLLLSLMISESVLFAPPGTGLGAILVVIALKLLPLLAFVPAIIGRRTGGTVWLSFVIMIYFCWAVLGAFEKGMPGWFAVVRCLLIGGLFTSCLLFVRWQREVSGT